MLGIRRGDLGTYFRRSQFEPLVSTILDDPVLADVPKNATVSDIDTLIGVELGSAMKLSILKLDGTQFEVAVLNAAKVRDLRQAVMKYIDSMEQDQLGHRHISWKHVWGSFCLCFGNAKLIEDDARLQSFGIKNNDQLRFEHHVTSKENGRHSHSKKRRFFHGLRKT